MAGEKTVEIHYRPWHDEVMRKSFSFVYLWTMISVLTVTSCSLNKLVVNKLADALTSGSGTTFTGDDDPELVRDALPFALKTYEALLEQTPENTELLLATGSAFAMYANAFVQTPAEMLPGMEYARREEMLARAKKLYLRGRSYLMRAMELRHPGFGAALQENGHLPLLEGMEQEDVPYLFWTSAAWMGAFSTNAFDIEMLMSVPVAVSLMQRALELEEDYGGGMIHDFFISYYGSVPEAMGGSEEKARYHFARAVLCSGGKSASAYVALATTVSVKNQDVDEFRDLLNKALAIDPDDYMENRLANTLSQRKARWLLQNLEDYFLLDSPVEE
jgi:predicted anti-sigma-YlaC factor YlaD